MNAAIFFGYGYETIENYSSADFETDYEFGFETEAFSAANLETLEYLSRFWLGTTIADVFEYRLPNSVYLMTLPNQQWTIQHAIDEHQLTVSLGTMLFASNVHKCIILNHPIHGIIVLLATAVHLSYAV